MLQQSRRQTLRFFKGVSSLLSASKTVLLDVKLSTLWKGD